MSALTGFSALSHFYLYLLSRNKVFTCYSEASRCYLLYSRTAVGSQPFWAFSALTAVGFSANAVHGNCHTFMSFLRDRAIGHSSRLEAGTDAFHRLDLVNGDTAILIKSDVEETSQCQLAVLTGEALAVFLECVIAACHCSLLKQMYSLGSVKMLRLAAAKLMASRTADPVVHRESQRIKCRCVELFCTAAYICKSYTADTADGSRKIPVDQLL